MRDFIKTRRFLHKWTSRKWGLSLKRSDKRTAAYTKFYNMGKNCLVEHNVEISRQHYLPGTIRFGDNVLIAKNTLIDYSGMVVVGDNVSFADGSYVLTHDHKHQHGAYTKDELEDDAVQSNLEICEGAIIGARAIIMPTCHKIGKYARISAGVVVANDVPDYAVVINKMPIVLDQEKMKRE